MAILSFEAQEVEYVPSSRGENANIFAPGHFAFSNFKSWRKESVFNFLICGPGAEIWLFHFLNSGSGGRTIVKVRKWLYFGPWAINEKLGTPYFLKLWKLKKNSVLIFCLWPRSRDMAISSFEAQEVDYVPLTRRENANILAPGPNIKKLRTLYFLQLLKLEPAKCPLFFYSRPRGQDICIFSPWQ